MGATLEAVARRTGGHEYRESRALPAPSERVWGTPLAAGTAVFCAINRQTNPAAGSNESTDRELADELVQHSIVASVSRASQVNRYLAAAELQPHRRQISGSTPQKDPQSFAGAE